jgi:hypothetical protein
MLSLANPVAVPHQEQKSPLDMNGSLRAGERYWLRPDRITSSAASQDRQERCALYLVTPG